MLSTPIHVNRMKYAYDRSLRPNSNEPPVDLDQTREIPGLVMSDCPEDSFEPLRGTQEAEKTSTPIMLGLPLIHDPVQEYDIDKVIRGRYRNGRLEYLVKWKGYPNSSNTWEPQANLNKPALDSLERHPVNISGKR